MSSPLPIYQVVDGYRLPGLHYSAETFREALKYKPLDGDTFIGSYPKTGTTWLQQILYLLFNGGVPPRDGVEFFANTPYLEKSGIEAVLAMKRPNAIKTHLPFHLVPYSSSANAKYIYVSRNPKDCCVSFFHHTVSSSAYNFKLGRFDDFFELFLNGEVDNGDYFDHQLSWYQRKEDPNVLFLIYEKMKSDLRSAVLEIAGFLGQDYIRMMERDNEIFRNIVEYSDFGYMKSKVNDFFNDYYNYPHTLVRKGEIGDWRNVLTDEQNKLLSEKLEFKLSGTSILNYWKDIGCV